MLPTGTLMLPFSDIEGSTSLVSRLGEWYAKVLSDQRAILAAASPHVAATRWGPKATASSSCSRRSATRCGQLPVGNESSLGMSGPMRRLGWTSAQAVAV